MERIEVSPVLPFPGFFRALRQQTRRNVRSLLANIRDISNYDDVQAFDTLAQDATRLEYSLSSYEDIV